MKTQEIEMKYKITNEIYEEIINYFKNEGIEEIVENQNDIYFSPTHFPFFGGQIDNECLRIRILENKTILGYKKFIPADSNKPAHCIEHELEIADIEKMQFILNDLRIEKSFTLKKERKIFLHKKNIEIALDNVEDLGYFIELEIKDLQNIEESLEEMKAFVKKFGITESMRNYEGYAYLLFNQKNKKNTEIGEK